MEILLFSLFSDSNAFYQIKFYSLYVFTDKNAGENTFCTLINTQFVSTTSKITYTSVGQEYDNTLPLKSPWYSLGERQWICT